MDNIIFELVLIFAGAAILATLFLYLKQPIILAYIALGVAIGPSGTGLIDNPHHIEQLSHIGIILLLFLIGLNLRPDRMAGLVGRVSALTFITSAVFMLLTTLAALLMGFPLVHGLVIGAALMFSSTIVGLKLIPTTTLYVVKYVITALYIKFDTIHEHTFLMSLGWGLMVAGVAQYIGLSFEMGAFIAGVSFSTLPIALVIAEELKPLRDFFLILFFFSIGAQFDLLVMRDVILPGIFIALIIVIAKPLIFRWGFNLGGEKDYVSKELGIRLGQASEFSLLVAYAALSAERLSVDGALLIQLTTVRPASFHCWWHMLHWYLA